MRIIKQGVIPKQPEYYGKCDSCGTEVVSTNEDYISYCNYEKKEHGIPTLDGWYPCPYCGDTYLRGSIIFSSEKKEDT